MIAPYQLLEICSLRLNGLLKMIKINQCGNAWYLVSMNYQFPAQEWHTARNTTKIENSTKIEISK